MEAVVLAFALGAGTVLAVKHGRKVARRAIGWTAEKTGFVTAKVADAVAEARRVARERFERGREPDAGRTELPPPSTPPRSERAADSNGQSAGLHRP
jgi:hypothetical protein